MRVLAKFGYRARRDAVSRIRYPALLVSLRIGVTTTFGHAPTKPVELAARAIQYSSQPGENVLDLFGGSGSTLIACEQQGRRAFLMELDPPYCDVIVQRWEKFTGRKAQRIGKDGLPGTDMPEKTPAVAAGVSAEGA